LENLVCVLITAGPAALSKGALTIETAACDLAENAEGLPSGVYVRITVIADNSDAPPPAEPASPFALPVVDLGVGLPLAQFFAAQLGGACRMEPVSDGVARVDLFLPRDVAGADAATARSLGTTGS
jgi:hypothetical protein